MQKVWFPVRFLDAEIAPVLQPVPEKGRTGKLLNRLRQSGFEDHEELKNVRANCSDFLLQLVESQLVHAAFFRCLHFEIHRILFFAKLNDAWRDHNFFARKF